MKNLILLILIICSNFYGCTQQESSFDKLLKGIPKLNYPLDTRKFDVLFKNHSDKDEYILDINIPALKEYKVLKSISFDIDSMKEFYDFNTDGVGFKCLLGYLDAEKYKIILYLNDVFSDFDYYCISAVLYSNEGKLLYKDEKACIIECRSASYIDDEYYRFFSIIKDYKNISHFGNGSSGEYKSLTKITDNGLEFVEIE